MGLFGGSEEKSLLSGSQKTISNQLGPILRTAVGRTANPYTQNQGQVVPDLLPQYNQVQNLLSQSQGLNSQTQNFLQPFSTQLINHTLPGAQLAQRSMDALSHPMLGTTLLGSASTNSMLQGGVFNSINQLNSPTQANAGFGGQFGALQAGTNAQNASSMQSAQGQIAGQVGFQNQLGDMQIQDQMAGMNLQRQTQASQMQQQLGQMNIQSGLQGSQLLGSMAALPLQQAIGMGGTLSGLQAQKQAQANAKYQDWLRTLPENSPWTQLALQYTGIPTQTGASSGGAGAMAGSVLGGAAAGAAAGSVVGPWGTAIGAGVGALGGLL